MKTVVAPDSAWEARLRWGSRRLTAEVLDGRGRTTLKLGDGPDDDIAIGSSARLELTWVPTGLEVRFSAGVEGEVSMRGDAARTFSELVRTGRVKEAADGFMLTLDAAEVLTVRIGTLIAEVRRARGRFPRLPIDATALVFIALALLGVGIVLASVMAPPEGPRLHWLKKPK
ncbi:MAG: hypothetical protein MUC96_23170 [Myxococcaceae bacterium]|jgi:hypothetical protein|nr:hypothetical protein [Myxococcaceae bacterium]